MFYWLFKRYMKRFTKEFEIAYQEKFDRSSHLERERMRTDWYWMEYLMFEGETK